MITDLKITAEMKIGDEWIGLPQMDNGFAVTPEQLLSAGATLTIRVNYNGEISGPTSSATIIYPKIQRPPDANITDVTLTYPALMAHLDEEE